jgi:hypothetical protein
MSGRGMIGAECWAIFALVVLCESLEVRETRVVLRAECFVWCLASVR